MHIHFSIDALMRFVAFLQSFSIWLSAVPMLLLIPAPEASKAYERNSPPFFYRCENGLTLVSHSREGDRKQGREPVSEYPYPFAWRSRVLRRTSHRQYILINSREYDCKPWKRKTYLDATKSTLPFIKVPDADELRVYAQLFKASRYRCEGDHTVRLRVTDFNDGPYRHALMEVDEREQFGLYFTRGNSGSFNGKERSDPGLAFYWYVGYEPPYSIKRNLVIKNEAFSCEMVQQ